MSTTEVLRLQLDANAEVQRLEAENRRLRQSNPQGAEAEDQESTTQRLKELYEQALRDLQDRPQELEASARQVEGLRKERDEATRFQEAQVARVAELEGETRRLSHSPSSFRGADRASLATGAQGIPRVETQIAFWTGVSSLN